MKIIDCAIVDVGNRPVTTVWFDGAIPVGAFSTALINGKRYDAYPVMGKSNNVVDVIASEDFTGKDIFFE